MTHEIDARKIRENLDYNPETGVFTWLARPETTRENKIFNKTRAGKIAGTKESRGYVIIRIYRHHCYAHRLAWTYAYGYAPSLHIDHIDADKSNNKLSNLREATFSENMINVGLKKSNKTGFKGVTTKRKKYSAKIKTPTGYKYLGVFSSPAEAALAYDRAAREYHGEFAVTNEMLGTLTAKFPQ